MMNSTVSNFLIFVTLLFCHQSLAIDEHEEHEEVHEDICLSETFQPRCMKNEVIFIRNATYGRMRVGRCITAEEMETLKSLKSGHIGCSAGVLPLLGRKCSGKAECEIRVTEIVNENIKPCPLGLNVYLEVTYDCIAIVDGSRSCAVDVSTNPIHLLSATTSCGMSSQPWIAEVPVGQKLRIGLLEFSPSGQRRPICQNRGVIVDKAGKRNVSICVEGTHREIEIYLSTGNSVQIYFNRQQQKEDVRSDEYIILKLQAVGCSDIIPPNDGYCKRNGDTIVVGCYASRKTWHLNCEDGKWIGVIGNCSQGAFSLQSVEEQEPGLVTTNHEHVVAMVALGGFTLAICLTIICVGVVCFRRFHVKGKMKQEYKTIDSRFLSIGNHPLDQSIETQPGPMYSVCVGHGDFNACNSIRLQNTNSVGQL